VSKFKKVALILFAAVLVFSFAACGGNGGTTGKQEELTITEEEKQKGYQLFTELGIKFKEPESFKKYPQNISAYDNGDPVDEENPLYAELIYEFVPNEVLMRFQEIMLDEEMGDQEKFDAVATEVWEKTKPLYAFTLVRVGKEPESPEALAELTKFANNEEIGRGEKYIQYLSTSEPNTEDLSEEAKAAYEEIMADVKDNMKPTVVAGLPVAAADGIQSIKNMQFTSQDLDGNEVDASFFKGQKLTMVNVWATWCGPCKQEIPEIAQIEGAYGGDVKVLGIVTDLNVDSSKEQEGTLDTAKEILAELNANYANIKVSPEIDSAIIKYVSGLPTTFFVDSNGDVVGELIIGARSLDDFKAAIDSLLQ